MRALSGKITSTGLCCVVQIAVGQILHVLYKCVITPILLFVFSIGFFVCAVLVVFLLSVPVPGKICLRKKLVCVKYHVKLTQLNYWKQVEVDFV